MFGLDICLTLTLTSTSGYLICGISSGRKNSAWSVVTILLLLVVG